ncbi:MAG: hypothetical protein ACXIUL_05995 [Wenzhouxiangella sp.]
MRPVIGEKTRWHFRHKVSQDCSLETYLHKMGKRVFIETYQACVSQGTSYTFEYDVPVNCNYCSHGPCAKGMGKSTYNLAKTFSKISEEKRDNGLIPDILIESKSGNKIYIEIAVIHASSDEKIASKTRIIEIYISDESDIDSLKLPCLSALQGNVFTYNFRPSPQDRNLKEHCHKEITCFTVNKNGKALIRTLKAYEVEQHKADKHAFIKTVPNISSDVFITEVQNAYLQGVNIKNCFLCRYHAMNKSTDFSDRSRPIFCKYHKAAKNSNDATTCEIYRPDRNVFRK